jgi:hypothetical protein
VNPEGPGPEKGKGRRKGAGGHNMTTEEALTSLQWQNEVIIAPFAPFGLEHHTVKRQSNEKHR